MTRSALLGAVAFAALLSAPAAAQPPDPPQGGFRIVDAKIEKDKLVWSETVAVPVLKEINRPAVVNGMAVNMKVTVTVYESTTVNRSVELKGVGASDAAGGIVPADKLAERLKEATPVVIMFTSLPVKHRALFKDKTLFLELPSGPAAKAPAGEKKG